MSPPPSIGPTRSGPSDRSPTRGSCGSAPGGAGEDRRYHRRCDNRDHRGAPVTDDGDHDRFAHYAKKADIARAYVTGEAIVALCGKKWVPSRDPSNYPICPTCAERKAAGWTP